jgi:hypothetical protein
MEMLRFLAMPRITFRFEVWVSQNRSPACVPIMLKIGYSIFAAEFNGAAGR